MTAPSIEIVWGRLKRAEGETFETKTGRPFTYEIEGSVFHPSRTKYKLMKKDFEKILALVPIDGPGDITKDVRGPSYIWAVLHDKRIRQGEW